MTTDDDRLPDHLTGPRLRQYVILEPDLRRALRLGPDVLIATVAADPLTRRVSVVVADPDADPIPPGTEPPIVGRTLTLEGPHALIALERQRQIDVEGYGPAHDAEHEPDALALAAACYALPPDCREVDDADPRFTIPPVLWPFDGGWKPTPHDRMRELVKAGALIVAEIDRLLNVEGPAPTYVMPGADGCICPPGETAHACTVHGWPGASDTLGPPT